MPIRSPGGLGRRAVALVMAAAIFVACSDGGPERADPTTSTSAPAGRPEATRAGPFPVVAGATTSRGELTDGLPIAEGSVLLGPVFPDLGEEGGGFVALLLVTGDPVAVYNSYVDAAAALGMQAGGSGGCVTGFGSITCARRVVDPADGEALSVLVERRPLGHATYVSHAALHYEPPGTVDPEDAGTVNPSPPTSTPASLDLPAEVAATPDDGWSQALSPGGPTIELPAGAGLAGPPGPCPCGGQGWSAVLRVEGDARAAIDDLAGQLGADAPQVRTGDGGRARVADLGLVPGGITQIRAVTDDRGTWLLFAVSLG
jgi:hypothetical protein